MGNGDDDQDDEEPGAGEYRVGQDVVTSVTLHRGGSGSRIWPSTAWRRARGLSGDGLALLCFPMSVRKEVYEEPRGHRQPGWPGVVRSGGGRDG